jgi:hypothetical protein
MRSRVVSNISIGLYCRVDEMGGQLGRGRMRAVVSCSLIRLFCWLVSRRQRKRPVGRQCSWGFRFLLTTWEITRTWVSLPSTAAQAYFKHTRRKHVKGTTKRNKYKETAAQPQTYRTRYPILYTATCFIGYRIIAKSVGTTRPPDFIHRLDWRGPWKEMKGIPWCFPQLKTKKQIWGLGLTLDLFVFFRCCCFLSGFFFLFFPISLRSTFVVLLLISTRWEAKGKIKSEFRWQYFLLILSLTYIPALFGCLIDCTDFPLYPVVSIL